MKANRIIKLTNENVKLKDYGKSRSGHPDIDINEICIKCIYHVNTNGE